METLRINFVGSLPDSSSGDTFTICSDDDYCSVSDLLRENLVSAYRSIWVREEHHFSWLKAQVNHCGLSHHRSIEFARTTPSSLLRDRWGVKIPDWLTDELIVEEGFLSTTLPSGCTSAVTGLLAPELGILPEVFPTRRTGELAEKLSDPKVEAALQQPILKTAWHSLLDQWATASSPSWAEPYCKRLESSPMQLWSDLTAWRLLRRYPEAALDYALAPSAAIFVKSIPADSIQDMSLSQGGRQLALDQIEQIFATAGTGVVTRAKFTKLIESVSGELHEEFTALELLLAKADFDITPSDVAEIEKRFKGCPNVSDARLSKLRLYVRPPRPEQIETQSPDAAAWVRWAREEYLPYRWWQINHRASDDAVEHSVAAFSKWYCQQFSVLHGDPTLSAIQVISGWRESILKDHASLILLVDNLPWFFWELLEKALAVAGFHRHESTPVFVPLPSHTSVCKPLLISGGVTSSGSDYLKMMKARSKEEWQDRVVHYAGGVDQLASLAVSSEPSVILLNYLAGDETLHGDAEASGSSWTEQLGMLYQNLAQAVGEFARRVSNSGRDFSLYVMTDHGSTLILPDERQAAEAQLTKKLFPNEKHRSATLSDAEAGEVPENLWRLGQRFISPFGEGIHFIPSGHNTVSSPGSRPFFCHGGATPEEVIVPSGVFRLYSVAWTLPKLRFVDLDLNTGNALFYIKRIVSVDIEVQNPNGEECRLELVTISPEVAEIKEFDAVTIPSQSTSRTKVSLYFGGNATAVSSVLFTFIFRIGQDKLLQTIELPVKITSAASGGTDLKNLL